MGEKDNTKIEPIYVENPYGTFDKIESIPELQTGGVLDYDGFMLSNFGEEFLKQHGPINIRFSEKLIRNIYRAIGFSNNWNKMHHIPMRRKRRGSKLE